MSLLADLENPDLFVKDPEAVVFHEYVEYEVGPDGKKTDTVARKYTKADLDEFAANTNKRDQDGAPCAMTIGHTIDDKYDADGKLVFKAKETDQPPIVGYWRKLRVDWSPDLQKYVIKATPYVRKDCYKAAKTYPRVSVEAWRQRKVIDPIAIIRRTPDQPTAWQHALHGRYSVAERDQRDRYAMEPGAPMSPLDPTAPPDALAPSQEELDKFMKCAAHCFPNLKGYHDKHMAASLAAPGGAPVPEPDKKPADDKDKAAMREREIASLKASLAEADKKTKALQDGLDLLMKASRVEGRKAELKELAAKYQLDEEKELAYVADLPADHYAAHVQRIKDSYRPKDDPTANPGFIPTTPKGARDFGVGEAEKFTAYLRDNHEALQKIPLEQRIDKARKWAMTGKDS